MGRNGIKSTGWRALPDTGGKTLLSLSKESLGADAEVEGFPSDASPIICEVEYKVSAESGGMLVGLKMWRQVGKFEINTVENARERLSR